MTSDKQVFNALLRNDLHAFVQKVFQTVSPNDKYLDNWHIRAICEQLRRIAAGETKRLIITMPPRHMKSISATIAFVAWLLGRNPKLRVICASYAQDLASHHSMQTRTVMESDWYQKIFPQTQLSDSKNTQSEFWTSEQGYRIATSLGGAMTGKGADILLIDDILKAEDGQSQTKRQQAHDWFMSTAATRLNDPKNGIIIVVQQRLHEADLPGELLAKGGWTHLNLPAIAEVEETIAIGPNQVHTRKPGDVLHEARMSKADLDQIKYDIGSYNYSSQYQQSPAPAGGDIVKLEWFKHYEVPFAPEPDDCIVHSWDVATTASQSGNYSVCLTWARRNNQLYLIDIFRRKMEFPTLRTHIPAHADKWKAGDVIVEATGVGLSLFQELQKLDPHRYFCSKPKDSKEDRLMKVAYMVENGWVHLPESAPWLQAFLQELESFPNGKYDDQVDAFSQSLKWLYRWISQSGLGFHD